MATYDYDLFVIGAGSGGVRASRISAELGAKVAIAENRPLGGTCVNLGCVPKKLFVYASHYSKDMVDAQSYGWNIQNNGFNWEVLRENKNKEILRLNEIYRQILTNAGVNIVTEKANIIDSNRVTVGGKEYTTEKILVATGGWPTVPDFPGSKHVVTSNEVFHLGEFPKKVVIVGGGYISVEFAGIFHGLGCEVHQLYRGDLFLRGFDYDIRGFLANEMRKKGMRLDFNSNISKVEKIEAGYIAHLEDQSKIDADLILYATGRKPNTNGLGLEKLGIQMNSKGGIQVDDNFQTNVPSIYAIGDVIDRIQLTPVALAEGMNLANTLYGNQKHIMDYKSIPTAVFSQPNIGTVGLTEEEARKVADIRIYKSDFRFMKYILPNNQERTLIKLIVDKQSDRVLGVHMVGPDAGEIIQGIAIGIKAGATKETFDSTIGIHPTLAEEFVTMREPVRETISP